MSVEVFDEDDFVPCFVVNQLVDQRPCDREAKAARTQSFFFSHERVTQRVVVRIVDRRVRDAFEAESLTWIRDPIQHHALGPNIRNPHHPLGIQVTAPFHGVRDHADEGARPLDRATNTAG